MGIDPRDCRLDVGFLLGDSTIPDDVDWDWALRDNSCVWLGIIDASFNPCQADDYNTCDDFIEVNTIILSEFDDVIPSIIPIDVCDTNNIIYAKSTEDSILNAYNTNTSQAKLVSKNIIVDRKPNLDIAKKSNSSITVRKSSNSVTAKRK